MKFKSVAIFTMLLWLSTLHTVSYSQDKNAITFDDVMKFKQIKESVISDYGSWIAYTANPDRGNGEVVIKSIETEKEYIFERGSKTIFSGDEKWAAVTLLDNFIKREKKSSKQKDLMFLNLENGDTLSVKNISSYSFSQDSKWFAVKTISSEKDSTDSSMTNSSSGILLFNLISSHTDTIIFADQFAFDSLSNFMAYTIKDTSGYGNGLYLFKLNDIKIDAVDTSAYSKITNLTWDRQNKLAYLRSHMDSAGNSDTSALMIWNGNVEVAASTENCPDGYYLPAENKLRWSKDGERLFFGYKKQVEGKEKVKGKEKTKEKVKVKDEEGEIDSAEVDIYDIEQIVDDRDLNVWHWNDPLIKTNEIVEWKKKKKHVLRAVYHINSDKTVFLADADLPDIKVNNNPEYGLGYSNLKYQKLRTWDGVYFDYVLVDLSNAQRDVVAEKIQTPAVLSPDGKYVVYYNNEQWHLYNTSLNTTTDLTSQIDNPFADEDHDYPRAAPGYGLAGWLEDDKTVLIYDKYDIWKFNTDTGEAINLTEGYGRLNDLTFRIYKLNKEKEFLKSNETVLLSAFHNYKKYTRIYSLELNTGLLKELVDENKKYTIRSKAKKSDKILFTKETYNEFPDLRISDMELNEQKKLTSFDDQREEFAWGNAELIEWNSIDGIPLQGVVIKPDNFEEGKPYPVLVYYYRFFSQRIHEFNDMVINHRPNFAYYVSNGYVVFLPDIRFEIGRPGFSATKCLVPGVQKLIDLGIAKPDGIALHGHSWSGYQTAFVVTQTDIFACAVAGAPVSNMTSAYSGIRWGSGLARQFQYEKTQSRIGVSLFENLMPYIENSPVFAADKINTPLLIQHGDVDEAVPWYQSIELYLAMRRLGKNCIFLHYKDEPHHLKKYPNKLDYSIKMREFIDHYCKDTPAPDWITKGEPYTGE